MTKKYESISSNNQTKPNFRQVERHTNHDKEILTDKTQLYRLLNFISLRNVTKTNVHGVS